MSKLLQRYQQQIIERPIRTYAIQAATMFTIGDCLAQDVIEKREKHDFTRTLRMTVYAGLIGGPVVGTWLTFISRAIVIQNRWKAAFARMAVDTVFFIPSIQAIFITGISLLEGRNLQQIKDKFEASYFKGLTNAYRFWPFVNLFGFAFVPHTYRPLLNSSCSIAWNAYLSYLNQQAIAQSQHIPTAVTVPLPRPVTASE